MKEKTMHYGDLLSEKIRATADMANLTHFEKFVLDRGFNFDTEESLKAAYDRAWKASHGILITREEFMLEANLHYEHQNAGETYDALAQLVTAKKLTPGEVLTYARYNWCLDHPEAVLAYQTERDRWIVNNCDNEITTERAVMEVNAVWGFEASRIKVHGIAYYDSTDWNWIRFDCAGMSWLMCNGTLYQVYN